MEEKKEYSHCLVCRRRLKNPKFRQIGMGIKCMQKYRKKQAAKVVQIEMF
jgi:hypothetical protein